ncbi:MAG: hypothetical protein AB1467_06290 [Candidatus Diapherotrites archaeon]
MPKPARIKVGKPRLQDNRRKKIIYITEGKGKEFLAELSSHKIPAFHGYKHGPFTVVNSLRGRERRTLREDAPIANRSELRGTTFEKGFKGTAQQLYVGTKESRKKSPKK